MAVKTKRKRKRDITFILNKAVKKFKKGETKYFDLIYKICYRRLEVLASEINFNRLKYDKDDFVQDGIIHIFNKVIKKYRRSKSKFSTFLYMKERQFRKDFIKLSIRKEILACLIFDDDECQKYLENMNEKMSGNYKRYIEFDSKMIMKEHVRELYLVLNNRERKLFKKLYNNRYRNDSYKIRMKLGRECGYKRSRSEYLIKSMTTKFKDKVLKDGEEKR